MKWYRLAADQGHAKAQYNLAMLYSASANVPRDDVAALMWFTLAEQQGFGNTQERRKLVSSRMTADQIAEAERRAGEKLSALSQ